jgi:hypothetical protein
MSNTVLKVIYDKLERDGDKRGSSDVVKSDSTDFIQGPLNMALSAALVLFSLLRNILPLCSGHAVGCGGFKAVWSITVTCKPLQTERNHDCHFKM